MTNETERIIDQIRRIRNLAENAGTEGEAAAAAAAMSRLLSKHNLDLSEIPTGEANDELDEPISNETIVTQTKQSDYRWREELLIAIATYNFCRVLHTTTYEPGTYKSRSAIILIGQPHNREVVKFLYDLLTETLTRLSKVHPMVSEQRKADLAFVKKYGGRLDYAFSPRRTFLYAAVETLRIRFRDEWKAFTFAPDGSRNEKALVLVNDTTMKLAKYIEDTWSRLGRHSHNDGDKRTMDPAAYAAGQAAGRSIPLQRGIGGGSSRSEEQHV